MISNGFKFETIYHPAQPAPFFDFHPPRRIASRTVSRGSANPFFSPYRQYRYGMGEEVAGIAYPNPCCAGCVGVGLLALRPCQEE
jgi:hypothetical protein